MYWHSKMQVHFGGGISLVNRVITGVSTIAFGALIACVPNFILTICPFCQSMAGKCTWAAKSEFGIGVLIMFLGILLAFVESGSIRAGISAALGFIGILAALTANMLVGFCDGSCNPECSCSSATAMLMTALGIFVAVISFANTFYLSIRKNT